MLKKIIKWLLIIVVSLPLYCFICLIRPFYFLRFGDVYSGRIGHLAGNLDNYLCSRKCKRHRELAIFSTREFIANHFLIDLFERTREIKFNNFFPKILFPLKSAFPNSPHFINFNEEMWAIKGEAALQPSPLLFTDKQIARGRELLKLAGIEGEFICFNHRDNAYLKQMGGDGNFHDYRNSGVENYRLLINHALDLGFSVVRLGNIIEEEIIVSRPGFVDFSGPRSSEFMDLFLIYQSKIMVGGNSDFSNVGRLFRKAQVIVNFAPLAPSHLWPFSVGTIILPKKLFSRSEGRLLTVSEMRALEVDIHYPGNFYADRNIDVVENSPGEIVAAFVEQLNICRGSSSLRPEDVELQDHFWKLFASPEDITLFRDKLQFRISTDFLRKHERILA